MLVHNTGRVWLSSQEALYNLQVMGVGKGKYPDDVLSPRQWQNWIGSSKVIFEMVEGKKRFNSQHIEEVGQRYINSNGLAYSIYYFDKDSQRTLEYINTYQCAEMWCVGDRQATNIIASGKLPQLFSEIPSVKKVGNEYFVLREAAEEYRVGYFNQVLRQDGEAYSARQQHPQGVLR